MVIKSLCLQRSPEHSYLVLAVHNKSDNNKRVLNKLLNQIENKSKDGRSKSLTPRTKSPRYVNTNTVGSISGSKKTS